MKAGQCISPNTVKSPSPKWVMVKNGRQASLFRRQNVVLQFQTEARWNSQVTARSRLRRERITAGIFADSVRFKSSRQAALYSQPGRKKHLGFGKKRPGCSRSIVTL